VSLNGTEESVSSFTREDLVKFHQQEFSKARGVLIVVGNVDPDDIRMKAKILAAGLPEGNAFVTNAAPFDPGKPALDVVQRQLPTNYILGYCPAPSPADEDYPAFVASMRILSNKLFKEVRTKRNLSYAPAAGVSRRANNYSYIYVTTVAPDTTLKVMFATIDSMQKKPLPQQDIKNEMSQAITRDYMQRETAAAQLQQLALYEFVGNGWQNAGNYITKLKTVTPSDVMHETNTYLHGFHIGVIGDSAKVDEALFTSK